MLKRAQDLQLKLRKRLNQRAARSAAPAMAEERGEESWAPMGWPRLEPSERGPPLLHVRPLPRGRRSHLVAAVKGHKMIWLLLGPRAGRPPRTAARSGRRGGGLLRPADGPPHGLRQHRGLKLRNPLRHAARGRLGRHAAALGPRDSHSPHHRRAGLQGRAVLRRWAELHLPAPCIRSITAAKHIQMIQNQLHDMNLSKQKKLCAIWVSQTDKPYHAKTMQKPCKNHAKCGACGAPTRRTLTVPRVLAIRAICAIWVSQGKPLNILLAICAICAIWVSQGKPLNIHSPPALCYMCYMCYMALYSTCTTDFCAYRISI